MFFKLILYSKVKCCEYYSSLAYCWPFEITTWFVNLIEKTVIVVAQPLQQYQDNSWSRATVVFQNRYLLLPAICKLVHYLIVKCCCEYCNFLAYCWPFEIITWFDNYIEKTAMVVTWCLFSNFMLFFKNNLLHAILNILKIPKTSLAKTIKFVKVGT